MSHSRSWWVSVLALGLSTACGSKIDVIGNGEGGAGANGGSGGAGGTLPPSCSVDTQQSPPYEVTFRFVSMGGVDTWLHQGCEVELSVTSCADGYSAALSMWPGCTVDCSDTSGCIACGACWDGGVLVDPSSPFEVQWSANTYTFGQTANGCECSSPHPVSAAHYRLTVPVYGSELDTTQGAPMWSTTVDFELPAPSGIVEVQLGGGI
jgi:hypothetical protein